MERKIRRVVTGHDKDGRAIVITDDLAPAHANPLRRGQVAHDIWKTSAMPVRIARDEPDPVAGPRQLHPVASGTVFRISEVPPETTGALRDVTPEKAREMFGQMGAAGAATYGKGGRHPLMHRTKTLDYAVVLDGEIHLVLDDGEVKLKAGDVVIQRGTSHAWSNRSGKMVRMLYVLIDGEFDSDLEKQFEKH
jgi:quercetin dioxygenase-like cupin family protein